MRGLETGSKRVANDYKTRMRIGLNSSGGSAKPVKRTTMEQPIRRGGPDKRIRKTVNSSAGISIYATGATASSLEAKNQGKGFWAVAPSTAKADMILNLNANEYGRDPIQASKPQIDIIEQEVLKEIDKLLG